MKKILCTLVLIVVFTTSFAQNKTSIKDKFKNVKALKNKEIIEVEVEILKPDNAALLGYKQSRRKAGLKRIYIEQFKRSNKLLYN